MGSAPKSRRTDDELVAILDETADWTVNGRRGDVLGHAASLRLAIDRASEFALSGAVVIALCRLPSDNIIVFPAQAARLRKVMTEPREHLQLPRSIEGDLTRRLSRTS
jgi:hypothetical protein